jgi:hypothetical protein
MRPRRDAPQRIEPRIIPSCPNCEKKFQSFSRMARRIIMRIKVNMSKISIIKSDF